MEIKGYELIKKKKLGFSWLEAEKENCLGFTFLLVGNFHKNYFSYKYGVFELRILESYLNQTSYSLLGYEFAGIPLRSVYEGLKISNLNPKRKLDNEVVNSVLKNKTPTGKILENSFKLYSFGVEIPYLYPLFSRPYNTYGGLRIKLGKKYEIWN